MLTLKKDGKEVRVVQSAEDYKKAMQVLKSAKTKAYYSLDFETTALRPDDDQDEPPRVRLSNIGVNTKISYIIDHDLSYPFELVCEEINELGPFYVFNVNFEGRWFSDALVRRGFDIQEFERRLFDVAHMRRSVMGGGPWNLKNMAKRDLDVEMNKDEQNSNWADPDLTNKQYFYAGDDAIITKMLGNKWSKEMTPDHWNGFHVINDAWRAVNECEDTGLLIDIPYHRKLIRMWTLRRHAAETAFRKYVPVEHIANIRSKKQISDYLKALLDEESIKSWPKTDKTEQLQTDRNTLRAMSYISPYPLSRALAALMVFNRADKYLGTYGETLITKQELSFDGRLRSRLNMAAAITGRFSSSGPNQQNFPNAYIFRYSFTTALGTVLALADYSGVEIRVLAELSGDKILLHDALYDDVHTQSAIAIFNIGDVEGFKAKLKAKDPRAKAMRTRAKAFTFQLLYGAGPAALAIALRCSVQEAVEAIDAWARRYSKAYAYRQYMFEKMRHDGFLPCASGRTIFVHRNERTMPVAANYPIQGSAADVMYRAMYHVQRLLEQNTQASFLCASVHDELLVQVNNEKESEIALDCLKRGMELGWLDIFPDSNIDHLAEAVIGRRWSDKA